MRFLQVTLARARALDTSWRTILHRFRGAAPSGLGIAHMVAESNGNTDPTVRDQRRRPVGLMKIPLRRARKLGYQEDVLKNTTNNLYVWGRLTNIDADYVSTTYDWWTKPNIEFWLAVRLFFILDQSAFDSLLSSVSAAGEAYKSTAGIQEWIRTKMLHSQRIGPHSRRDLRRIADHLDDVRKVMQSLDGPQFTSERFSQRFIKAPGSNETQFRTITAPGAA